MKGQTSLEATDDVQPRGLKRRATAGATHEPVLS